MKRAALAVAVLLGGLLVAEGALSLLGQPRLAERLKATSPDSREGPESSRVETSDAPTEGLYQAHPDPRVGYTLRREAALELLGARFQTNELGFRVEPSSAAQSASTELLVLGDSVAFGYGLDDGETLAAQLEQLLRPLAGDDAAPVRARSMAVPGWNHRQAVSALIDHWPSFAPQIVVYLPISNDLGTASAPFENGQVRLAPDPNEPDPLLLVSRSQSGRVERKLLRLRQRDDFAGLLKGLGPSVADPNAIPDERGPRATESDLAAESSRRYDENAASILRLHNTLKARGAQLLVFMNGDSAYTMHLARRLEQAAPELPLLFGQRGTTPAMQLEGDAHPNAETVAARAVWVAQELVERGWIPRRVNAAWEAPTVPEAYTDLRLDAQAGGGLAARAAQHRARDRRGLNGGRSTVLRDGVRGWCSDH